LKENHSIKEQEKKKKTLKSKQKTTTKNAKCTIESLNRRKPET
jgi:hypothetical protein